MAETAHFVFSRKTKTRFVLGVVALVVAVCICSSGEDGEMTITCTGLASNDSRLVSFTVSNSFSDEMYCDYELREFRDDEWQPVIGSVLHKLGHVAPHCATAFTVLAPGTNRWQVEVSFMKPWPDNIFTDARINLMQFTSEHNLSVLDAVAKLGYTWHWRSGPEMFGNKPLAGAQK